MAYWNWQLHNYCVFCRCLSSVRLALFALIIPKIRLFLSRYHVFLQCFSCVALHCTWIISWHVDPPAPDPVCSSNLQTMLHACSNPGFTTNPSKTMGPCTCLELLGIVIDSVAQEARISESHLQEIIDLLLNWHSCKSCTKRQLQSLIGEPFAAQGEHFYGDWLICWIQRVTLVITSA